MLENYNIFLSWSGEHSHKIAEELNKFLKRVIQTAKPYISSDIKKGSVWFSDITTTLNKNSIGIFCITQENKNKPWILFEAGALNKGLTSNNVCTLLINLSASDIQAPLSEFNHTIFVIVQLQREGKKVCENFTKKGLKKNTNEIKWVHGCIQ